MTGPWLLDVNVLLAWLWPAHQAHKAASTWMKNSGHQDWATCAITEMGFLRIVTNPAFSPNAPRWSDAISMLRKQTKAKLGHSFWPDSLPAQEVDRLLGSRILGHSQITDAYLLSIAIHNKGSVATFDRRMSALAPAGSPEHNALLILQP